MPPDNATSFDVYHELLGQLRQAGAESLAQDVERTVARGVVLAEQKTDLYKSSSVYRPMEGSEALAVAVEFLVTALEVPLMLNAASHELGGSLVEWRPERPGTEREDISPIPAGQIDQNSVRALSTKLLEIAQELEINLPEIA